MPKSALELAQQIHASRKDPQFWQTGLKELLANENYQDLLSIAQADVEAAKIFLGSNTVCQHLTPLEKAQIIHHHHQNADFLTQLSQNNGLLAQARTSLLAIGKQDVDAAQLFLSSAEIMQQLSSEEKADMLWQHYDKLENFQGIDAYLLDIGKRYVDAARRFLCSAKTMQQLSPQKKAEMLWHHRRNLEFFQDINALLAQTGTSLLEIAKADPVGAGTILGSSKLNQLFKPQALEKALTDPQFALEFFRQSPAIWGRLLTPFEKAVLIVHHRHAKFTDKNVPEREESFLASLLKDTALNPSENSLLVKIAFDDPRAAQLFLMSKTLRQLLARNAEGIIKHWRDEFELARANRPANREFRHNLAEVQKFIQEHGESPYRSLGIARDASPEQIRQAYRTQSLTHHPDRGGNDQIQTKLNAANAILTDAKKREILDRILAERLGDFEARLITVHLLADPKISQQVAANPETTTALNARQSALINRLIEQLQTEDQSDELPPEKTFAINALEALKTYTALGIELNQAKERIINEYSLFTLPRNFLLRIFATLALMLEPKLSAAVNATDLSAKSDSKKPKLLVKEKSDITNQGISRSDMIVGALVFSFALLCAGIAIALTATGVFSPIGALFGITSLGTLALLAANGALGFSAGLLLGSLLTFAYSLFNDSPKSAQAAPVKTTTPAMPKRETTAVADPAVQGEQYGHVLHRTAPPPVKSIHAPGPNSPKP